MSENRLTKLQFLKFLSNELSNTSYSPDQIEGLEVAKQCLETAFNINEDEYRNLSLVDSPLAPIKKSPTEADRKEAEILKQQGNMCLQENLIDGAIECYTKAIQLVDDNPVYFSNRAAAYTNSGQLDLAVADCRKALEIDPVYSKAYGRLGLVYSNKADFRQAADCYRKALDLDPGNAAYRQNLELARSRIGEPTAASTTMGGVGAATAGGVDLSSMLNSPQFMSMASQLMSDPAMRSQLTNMMQGFMGGVGLGGGGGGTAQPGSTGPAANQSAAPPSDSAAMPDLSSLLTMGERLAQQMRSSNPDLVEQLRSQYQQGNGSGSGAAGNTPNPESE